MNNVQRQKMYAVLNLVAILMPILAWIINSDPSEKYMSAAKNVETYFTPAPYTFYIWAVIYIALLVFAIYQIKVAFGKAPEEYTTLKVGPFLIIALAFNALWSTAWMQGQVAWSTVCLFVSFFSLFAIIMRLKMQTIQATRAVRTYTWIPISLYAGWMMAACVVGLTTLLANHDFASGKATEYWAIAIIVVVGAIYYYLLKTKNLGVYTLVGAWALFGVAYYNWCENKWVYAAALIVGLLLCVATLMKFKSAPEYTIAGLGKVD